MEPHGLAHGRCQEGVKAAVAAMEGKDLGEKYVDTGVSVITKKNMADFL